MTNITTTVLRITDAHFFEVSFPKALKPFMTNFGSARIGKMMCWHCMLLALTLMLFIPVAKAQAPWAQVGRDIDGEDVSDLSGFSVSLSADGRRVAIGAISNDHNGNNSGHVRVYQWNGSNWIQLGADIDGEAARDESGWSVSLSADGTRVAIGAPGSDNRGISSGHVRVYQWSGSAWVQLGSDIDGEAMEDYSGLSVSLSADGRRVAIGAPGNDAKGNDSGQVRVYQWNSNAWVQLGTDIDGEAKDNSAGTSVSLSSDGMRVAIGAPGNDGKAIDSGHARVYEWNGSAWVQLGMDIDGETGSNGSGFSVSLSADGRRVAIGAHSNNDKGDVSGHVRVYQWNNNAWVQLGADIDGEAAGDQSGWSISLSPDGTRVAIGAPGNDSRGTENGHVRVYQWTGSAWVQQWADIDGEASGDQSGYSVALSADGTRVAIGAPFNDGIDEPDRGHVRVFTSCPASIPNCTSPTTNIAANIQLFPNPTSGTIQLKEIQADRIAVCDNMGRLVLQVEKPGAVLDLTGLPAGMYFLKLTQGSAVYVARVVKADR